MLEYPILGNNSKGPLSGCACDWKPAVTATGDWANLSSQKINIANKPQVYWKPCLKLGLVYFLDAKRKTHGLSHSRSAEAKKNRTLPFMSIMCDLVDLIFISSSPNLSFKTMSGSLCKKLLRSTLLCHCMKPWQYSAEWRLLSAQGYTAVSISSIF